MGEMAKACPQVEPYNNGIKIYYPKTSASTVPFPCFALNKISICPESKLEAEFAFFFFPFVVVVPVLNTVQFKCGEEEK